MRGQASADQDRHSANFRHGNAHSGCHGCEAVRIGTSHTDSRCECLSDVRANVHAASGDCLLTLHADVCACDDGDPRF